MTPLFEHTEQPKPQRDSYGRFTKGNQIAQRGGYARAAALSPRRRRQIARQGWRGLVTKHFAGDEQAAKTWLGAVGAYHYDQAVRDAWGAVRPAFPHPGAPSDFRSRLYQLYLLAGTHLDVNFYKEEGEIAPNVAGWAALVVFALGLAILIAGVEGGA